MVELTRIDSGEHYLIRLTESWPKPLQEQADDPLAPAMQDLLTVWHRRGDADLVIEAVPPVLSRGDANLLLNWLTTSRGAARVDFEYLAANQRTIALRWLAIL